MEYDAFDIAAGHDRTNDMTKFVDRHHCEPAQSDERSDEQELVKSFHSEESRTRNGQHGRRRRKRSERR
jgi:hypothetical protein